MNEIVLGLRDALSPEMREIRDRGRIAELNRIGHVRFIARRTIQCTMLLEGMNAVAALSRMASGKAPWRLFHSADATSFFWLGIIGVIVGAIASSRDIVNLSATYPDDVAPPT